MKYELKKIKDICSFIGGSQPPKSEFIYEPKDGYVRLIQTRDRLNDDYLTFIPKNSTTKFCEESDILIGRYGPPIFQIFRGFKGAYNVALMKAEPINGVNKEYLYYFLLQKSILNYVDSMSARTGGQTGVELDSLYEYPVLLPDALGQEKISGTLKAIDDKIKNNKKIAAELEAMAKTIYDYWFTQFDFPNEEGKPYHSSGGEMVWNEQLKREIPKSWSVNKLSKYLDCNKQSIRKEDSFEYINYLDTGNLTDNMVGSIERFDDISMAPSRAQRIVRANDILYSTVRPNQRHYGIIKNPENNMVASTGFSCLSCKYGSKYNDLFYLFITSSQNTKKLCSIAASSVSAYPSINSDDILNLQIVLPEEIKEVDNFVEKISVLLNSSAHYYQENKELLKLRDWLLPMLMNGQATVE